VQEKLEQQEPQEKLDLRVPPALRERLAKLDKPVERVQAVLLAKRALQVLAAIPESQEKQELRASLELLDRRVKQGLLERLGLPVPRDLRVVVVPLVKPVPPALRDIREKLDRQV
jgi:hypothetical protein